MSKLHLLDRAVVAKLPWQQSGRGRGSIIGKRAYRAKALKARGEDLCREIAKEMTSSRASLGAL